jgi:hypothetical protein
VKAFLNDTEERIYHDRVKRAQKGDRPALIALINFHASRGEDKECARWHSFLDPSGHTDWLTERTEIGQLRFHGDSASQVARSQAGTVYVIQDSQSGLYKIGITTNMPRRMRELGVGKTARLVQQKQVGDARAVEKALHSRYSSARLPQTEYFKLSSPPSI